MIPSADFQGASARLPMARTRGLRPALLPALALGLLGALGLLPPLPARADNPSAEEDALRARDDQIDELQRTVAVLVDEVARLRTQVVVPEEAALKSSYGLGPAASKVYGVERGLSIGGYGEAFYRNFLHDKGSGSSRKLDDSDFLRMVLYFGYKFSDKIVFNSEIEFEHGSTEEGGSVSVEFAALDFLYRDWLNARAGLLLVPMGFINEIHEPPFFFGVQRPLTERSILPATWRENGVGVFGRIGETLSYRSYVTTGFEASDFTSGGIRSGRQNGSESLSEDLAWVGRLDWTPSPDWLLGGSLYAGKSGQDEVVGGQKLPGARLTMGELHAQYRRGPLHTRALFAMSHLANAGRLNDVLSAGLGAGFDGPIAERMFGGYLEAAYDVWSLVFGEGDRSLSPFFRVEYVDTQASVPSAFDADRTQATWLFTPGIQYKPHANVVLKAEYRNFQQRVGDAADELSFGLGFAF